MSEQGYIQFILVGVALIVINVLSHLIKELYKVHSERKQMVERSIEPVVKTAEHLLSRICDIFVNYQEERHAEFETYKEAIKDKIKFDEHLKNLTPLTVNRHESTAFRLVKLLAVIEYFNRQTAEIKPFPHLKRARYYLTHKKLEMGLRGKLYNYKSLGTEVQDEIATTFLESNKLTRACDLTIGSYCKLLLESNTFRELVKKAMDFVCVNTSLLEDGQIDRKEEEWKHLFVLMHFGVYLADFCQYFGNNSAWEEYRFIFVRFIKQWNVDSNVQRYLYEPGDIGRSYLHTFPGETSPYGFIATLWHLFLNKITLERYDDIKKWTYLLGRSMRFIRRHDWKLIGIYSLKIRNWKLSWHEDVSKVYGTVKVYSEQRLGIKVKWR